MMKKTICQTFGAALAFALLAMAPTVKASSVPVYSDTGAGSASITGTATGAVVTSYGISGSGSGTLLTINGAAVTGYSLGISEDLTSHTSGTGSKEIQLGADKVLLEIKITSVIALQGVLLSTGTITSATYAGGDGLPGNYDFKTLVGGMTTITETSNYNFAGLFGHAGVSTTGVIAVAESVPEPGSMALLGIGMTGFLAFRRIFKRSKSA